MTIRGLHTVHELSDLWNLYHFEFEALFNAVGPVAAVWALGDPPGWATFKTALDAFGRTYVDLAPAIQPILAGASADSTPDWDNTLALGVQGDMFNWLQAQWKPFNGLDRMMRQGPPDIAAAAPTYKGLPKPTAPDLDLQAYQLADRAAKWLQASGNKLLWAVGLGGLAWYLVTRRSTE